MVGNVDWKDLTPITDNEGEILKNEDGNIRYREFEMAYNALDAFEGKGQDPGLSKTMQETIMSAARYHRANLLKNEQLR